MKENTGEVETWESQPNGCTCSLEVWFIVFSVNSGLGSALIHSSVFYCALLQSKHYLLAKIH